MKILFCHGLPFFLAHGGVQIQIEQTRAALEKTGIEVEFLRWWDDAQTGDIIHYFGRPSPVFIRFAQQKGIKVVLADLLTAQGSRPAWRHWLHKNALHVLTRLPGGFATGLSSQAYRLADACFALTSWEAHLMTAVFGAPQGRIHVVPNGVEQVFFDAPPVPRDKWLVCTATITQRKRVLELTRAAVAAGTPLWIIGKPYANTDAYHQAFLDIARANPGLIRYEGGISDRARLAGIYREARGFVLLSAMESLSLSALEAAACECPLLLSDLPWARGTFGKSARYCAIADTRRTAECLRAFYEAAPSIPPPPLPLTWLQVAGEIKSIYESMCNR